MEFRTNDSILNEVGESKQLLKLVKKREWKQIGHTEVSQVHHKIIKGQIEDKRSKGQCILRQPLKILN